MKALARACVLGVFAAQLVSITTAASAAAASFTLNLSAPSTATIGQPFLIHATGTDPTDQGALYLEVDSIPASVTTTCPDGYLDGSQLATSTGGDLIGFDQRENLDASGNFAMAIGYTPRASGQILLCGYTDDGATDTLATASTLVNVQPVQAPSPPPPPPTMPAPATTPSATPMPASTPLPSTAKPVNTRRPRVTRSAGTLVCNRGGWSKQPTSFSYRWILEGRQLHSQHGPQLTITRKLRGQRAQCKVTASNTAGSGSALSRPVLVRR